MAEPQRLAPIKEPKTDRDPPAKQAPGRGQAGKATDNPGAKPETPANVPGKQGGRRSA